MKEVIYKDFINWIDLVLVPLYFFMIYGIFLIAKRFMKIQGRQNMGSSEVCTSCPIKHQLAANCKKIVAAPNRHLIFSVKRTGFIGNRYAAPLCAVDALQAEIATKNSGQ